MCSNVVCCSFPHDRKAVVIAACLLSLMGTVLGTSTGGFFIGWLLAVFTSVVLVMTTCQPVKKGLLVAAGICGIIAALCQFASSVILSLVCGVVKEVAEDFASLGTDDAYADALQGYNDAIKELGADEGNYFIQSIASNNSTVTEEELEDSGDFLSGFGCSFLNTLALCGYISGALLVVASILAFCIPPAVPAGTAQQATPTVTAVLTPEQAVPADKKVNAY